MQTRSYFNIILVSTFLIEIILGITGGIFQSTRKGYLNDLIELIELIVLLSVPFFSGIYTVSFMLK